MPKATLTLKSGATVTIEGSTSEVHKLLELHDGQVSTKPSRPEGPRRKEAEETAQPRDPIPDIVNLIRSCDDAERIEKQILDKPNVVNRCLLPLYIIHQQLHNSFGLTTGQIGTITKELGVPIAQSNVAHAIAASAGRFVMGVASENPASPSSTGSTAAVSSI